ncbi:aspartate/glutamate racemase family protein, partial [Cupriavidus sp.]
MKLKIINPNTTESMTEKIGQCARAVAEQGTRISAVSPRMGPASIESHYDEALSVPGILDEILAGEQEGVDGYVIACFGDPGLYAAREVARGPVIGIAEAAMHMASMVGSSFSVVTTLARTCNIAWHLAERYGMKRFCSNVRACDLPVLDLERPGSDAR